MPPVCDELPEAAEVLTEMLQTSGGQIPRNLSASGYLSLEVFAGCCVMTLGLLLQSVPALKPWDAKYGEQYNVLTQGQVLLQLAWGGWIASSHIATPCQSNTFARWPQLRSLEFLDGLPGLQEHQQQLVDEGNLLMAWSVELSEALYAMQAYFSLENPELVWLWLQPGIRELHQRPGVILTRFLFKQFAAPFVKPTLFLHNVPELEQLAESAEMWDGETVTLRGQCWWQGRLVFRTHLAQDYPVALGRRYGQLMSEALANRESALQQGLAVPMASKDQDFGIPAKLLSMTSFWMHEGADSEACPDLDDDTCDDEEAVGLVPHGLGAPLGLTEWEHVQWALQQEHVMNIEKQHVDQDLRDAVEYELTREAVDLDAFREQVFQEWTSWLEEMADEQVRWANTAPEEIRPQVSAISGPWFGRVLRDAGMEEHRVDALLRSLHGGFEFAGLLPECEVKETVRPAGDAPVGDAVEQLLQSAELNNRKVIERLNETEYSQDVWDATVADAQQGWMTYPEEVVELPVDRVLTRRLPVRELRSKGWRTRVVDHATESEINDYTAVREATQHDGLDVLVWILFQFMLAGVRSAMFKGDISSAFRRLPVLVAHLALAWVVFVFNAVIYMAQHRSLPFGTISAVQGWHRAGAAILFVMRRKLKLPMARYVDDYFGANRAGCVWHGSRCLEMFTKMLGLPCDEAKSEWDRQAMVVLGADVKQDFEAMEVTTCIQKAKAQKWHDELQECHRQQRMDAGVASQFAGRLSCSVTMAANRVGRAYIKPFYAQSAVPLSVMSGWLLNATTWFMAYLSMAASGQGARRMRPGQVLPHVRMWTDAAGESRMIAAVIEIHGEWHYTYMKVPQSLWDQLLPRGDHQIGVQEMLAIVLGLNTFESWMQHSRLTNYIDNDGVLLGVLKASSRAPEVTVMIARLWLLMADWDTTYVAGRVESKANVADGPTRDRWELLEHLKAVYHEPQLPDWLMDLWQW